MLTIFLINKNAFICTNENFRFRPPLNQVILSLHFEECLSMHNGDRSSNTTYSKLLF